MTKMTETYVRASRRPTWLLLPALVCALAAHVAQAKGSDAGPLRCAGATGIQVQNLDPDAPATLDFRFFAQRGDGSAIPYHLGDLPPGRAGNVYLPRVSELAPDVYAANGWSSRLISAIVRTDWPCSGAAALYSDVQVGRELALPLALIDFASQRSHVTVQHAGGASDPPASVELLLFAAGQAEPVARELRELRGGMSQTLVLGVDAFEDVVPNTAQGFLGSMVLRSADMEIGATSFVAVERSDKAVYAFEAQPIEAASEILYAPLIRNRFYGYDTGISVMNPGTDELDVSVTYVGGHGSCQGQRYAHGPVTLPPRGIHAFYQGPGGQSGLPEGCVGTAVIRAEGGGVLAIVNDSLDLTEQSAAYNVVSVARTSTRYALPLVRNRHIDALRMTTGIQVMNTSDTERATVTIELFDASGERLDGCGSACSRVVEPLEATTFYPGASSLATLPPGRFGSALVTGDQPLAVIVNDVSELGVADAATYNAIPLGLPDGSPFVRIPYASR